VDDRRADILGGQCQRLVAFGAYLVIPARVVECVRKASGQASPGERRLDEGAAAPAGGR
jgi:hypothetical protein